MASERASMVRTRAAAPAAAAELWVTADELAAKLGMLDPVLADLNGPGLSRADFTGQFAVAVCALKVGLTDACP